MEAELMSKIRVTAGAAITAVVAMLTLTGIANAWSGPIYHTSDYAYTAEVNDDIIVVCDQEADGHGVRAEYYLNNGSRHAVGDGNGSRPPCYGDDWRATPYWVTQYRVCESGVSCTSWARTDGPGGQMVKTGEHNSLTPQHITR
jgi:hypothetical protein